MSKFSTSKSNRFGSFQRNNSFDMTKIKTNHYTVKNVVDVSMSEEIPIEAIYHDETLNVQGVNPMKYEEIPDSNITPIINTDEVQQNNVETQTEQEERVKLKDVVEYIIAKDRLDKIIKRKKWGGEN